MLTCGSGPCILCGEGDGPVLPQEQGNLHGQCLHALAPGPCAMQCDEVRTCPNRYGEQAGTLKLARGVAGLLVALHMCGVPLQ